MFFVTVILFNVLSLNVHGQKLPRSINADSLDWYLSQPASFSEVIRKMDSTFAIIDSFAAERPMTWNGAFFDHAHEHISDYLTDYLVRTLPRFPESMTSPISCSVKQNPVGNSVAISSRDGNVREWNWNSFTGGAMPQFCRLIEYKTSSGIRITSDDGDDTWYDTIFSIQKHGSTIYLSVEGHRVEDDYRHAGWRLAESLEDFSIADTVLIRNIPLFITENDTTTYLRRITHFDNITKITLKADGKTLLLTGTDDDNIVKHGRYVFNGDYFVYKGIVK